MSSWLNLLAIFAFALVLEVSWVFSVRLVDLRRTSLLVLTAMGMQTISYLSTLILVEDKRTMVAGILGAGLGVIIAMRFPGRWLRGPDPQ